MTDHEIPLDREAAIVAFLAPLSDVRPVQLGRPRGRQRRARVAVALTAAAATTIATATAAGVLGRPHLSHNVGTPLGPGGALACSGLLGMSGDAAGRMLAGRGLHVSWRFTSWGDRGAPSSSTGTHAVLGGYTTSPEAPPAGSVVWDVDLGVSQGTAIVFLQAADDPNAPAIVRSDCP